MPVFNDILFDIFNATNTYDNFEIANIVISGNSKKLNKALNDIYNASGYYNELIPAIRFKVKKLIEILEYNEDETDINKKINNSREIVSVSLISFVGISAIISYKALIEQVNGYQAVEKLFVWANAGDFTIPMGLSLIHI